MRPAVVAKLNALMPELYETVFWLTVVGVITVFVVAVPQYWAFAFVARKAPTAQSAITVTIVKARPIADRFNWVMCCVRMGREVYRGCRVWCAAARCDGGDRTGATG